MGPSLVERVFNKGNHLPRHDASRPGVQGVQNARRLKRKAGHTQGAALDETGGAEDDDDPDE